jgi:tetratricopeptide (TPR) repeat protein
MASVTSLRIRFPQSLEAAAETRGLYRLDQGLLASHLVLLVDNTNAKRRKNNEATELPRRAAASLRKRQFAQAAEELVHATELAPRDPTAHHNYAVALYFAGRFTQAIASYKLAISLGLESPYTYLGYGLALESAERPQDAIEAYGRSINLGIKEPALFKRLAFKLVELGRYNDAVALFQRALDLDPDDAQAHVGHGLALSGIKANATAGRVNEARIEQQLKAIMAFDAALGLAGSDAAVRFHAQLHRGIAFGEIGRLLATDGAQDKSKEAYEAAIRSIRVSVSAPHINDNYDVAYVNLAEILVEIKRPKAAIEVYDEAISRGIDTGYLHYNRANALAAEGRNDDAVLALDRAVHLGYNTPSLHKQRGLLLGTKLRLPEALAAFDAAIKGGLNDPEIQKLRGITLGFMDRIPEAVDAFHAFIFAATERDYQRASDNIIPILHTLVEQSDSLKYLGQAFECYLKLVPTTEATPEVAKKLNEGLEAIRQKISGTLARYDPKIMTVGPRNVFDGRALRTQDSGRVGDESAKNNEREASSTKEVDDRQNKQIIAFVQSLKCPDEQRELAEANFGAAWRATEAGLSVMVREPDIAPDELPDNKAMAADWNRAIAEVAPTLTKNERAQIWAEAQGVTKPPIRKLTPYEVAAIKGHAERHPWGGRPTHRYPAFQWVQENYGKWIPGLLQHHLKFDKSSLYEAFTKRVSREGLPEWLDVPTEGDAELRNAAGALERAKILAVRRLSRDETRGRRFLKRGTRDLKI